VGVTCRLAKPYEMGSRPSRNRSGVWNPANCVFNWRSARNGNGPAWKAGELIAHAGSNPVSSAKKTTL
jgi:hypothetical protein